MKIINKHTYVNITEKKIETQYTFKTDPHYKLETGYQVIFTIEYDRVIFWKAFHKKQIVEVPFLFKTLEAAKDFCEINPNFKFFMFENENGEVTYKTYKLTDNKNNQLIGYIWWNANSVIITDENCNMVFDFDKNPIVYGFVKNIWLDDWEDTHSLKDIRYYGFETILSKLVPVKQEEPKERQWKFELVNEKE